MTGDESGGWMAYAQSYVAVRNPDRRSQVLIIDSVLMYGVIICGRDTILINDSGPAEGIQRDLWIIFRH